MKMFYKIKDTVLSKFTIIDSIIMFFFFMVSLMSRFWLLPNISTNVFRGIPNIYSWMALWNCRVLDTLNFSTYWTSNAMFPYHNSLAFSESMMGFAPFIYPIWKITGNPVLTINILSILLLWLCASITYFVLRAFKFDRYSSIIGSLIFAFYPWVLKLSSLGRFHMQGLIWLPIIIYVNYKFWQNGKKKHLIIFFVFFLWTFLFSLYYGIFLTVFIGIWNFIWFFYERKLFSLKKILFWALTVFMVWLVMLPVFLVYHQVSSGMGVERSLENQVQYTGNVWSWLTIPDENWLWGQKIKFLPRGSRDGIIENFIFPGFVVAFLFIFAFFFKKFPKWLNSLKWTSFSIFILAIGPFMLGIPWKVPMPFTLLWYIFPPLKATRNPHRLAVFVVLCIAFMVAFMLNYLNKKKKISKIIKVLLISMILIETITVEKATKAIGKTTPLIYKVLNKDKQPHTLVELPMNIKTNLRALTFSSFHWQRIINGSSNYWPPLLGYLDRELRAFPSDYTIQLLQALSVDRIIVNEKQYFKNKRVLILKKLIENNKFTFLGRSFGRSIWSLSSGDKFIEFNPKKHIMFSLLPNSDKGKREVNIIIPIAEHNIVFNYRAPFHSQFLSSKKWWIELETMNKDGKWVLTKKVEWKAPPIFSKKNYKLKMLFNIKENPTKKIRIYLNIFDNKIQLKRFIGTK